MPHSLWISLLFLAYPFSAIAEGHGDACRDAEGVLIAAYTSSVGPACGMDCRSPKAVCDFDISCDEHGVPVKVVMARGCRDLDEHPSLKSGAPRPSPIEAVPVSVQLQPEYALPTRATGTLPGPQPEPFRPQGLERASPPAPPPPRPTAHATLSF